MRTIREKLVIVDGGFIWRIHSEAANPENLVLCSWPARDILFFNYFHANAAVLRYLILELTLRTQEQAR